MYCRPFSGAFIAGLLFLMGCGSGPAPTYSMQVTNISNPGSSSAAASSDGGGSTSPLFQFWYDHSSQITLNLVPLSESLTSDVFYSTADGDICQGHAIYNSAQNTLTISVDDGASTCLAMNGIYNITLSAGSLDLVGTTTSFQLIN
jgi:hypothetical protein